jgi:hypothetical protein
VTPSGASNRERLLVEQVRADEVQAGQNIVRSLSGYTAGVTERDDWAPGQVTLRFLEALPLSLMADAPVLRVVAPSPSEPDEVDKLCCCSSDCDSWECPIHGC